MMVITLKRVMEAQRDSLYHDAANKMRNGVKEMCDVGSDSCFHGMRQKFKHQSIQCWNHGERPTPGCGDGSWNTYITLFVCTIEGV